MKTPNPVLSLLEKINGIDTKEIFGIDIRKFLIIGIKINLMKK